MNATPTMPQTPTNKTNPGTNLHKTRQSDCTMKKTSVKHKPNIEMLGYQFTEFINISKRQHLQISTSQHFNISTSEHLRISTPQHAPAFQLLNIVPSQPLNIPTSQHLRISTFQHFNISTSQHLNISFPHLHIATFQHLNTLTLQHQYQHHRNITIIIKIEIGTVTTSIITIAIHSIFLIKCVCCLFASILRSLDFLPFS